MLGQDFRDKKGTYYQKINELLSCSVDFVEEKNREHYDLTHSRVNKRLEVAVNGLDKAKSHLNDVCDISSLEAYFAISNTLFMKGGYNDTVDDDNAVTLSAAIWILDQLTLQGQLEECYQYLPVLSEDEVIESSLIPFAYHPMYDFSLIYSMVVLIRQRNTSAPFPDHRCGTLQWDKGVPDSDEQSKKNREAFEKVIGLLDREAIERAIKKYEADVWTFYRLSFQIYYLIEKHIEKLTREALETAQSGTRSNLLSINNCFDPFSTKSSPSLPFFDEIKQLQEISMTELSLENDRERVVRVLKRKRIISEKLGDELISFHVDDPFETAFALMYLLDTGSDIPWFYYGSLSVAYTMNDQLPYGLMPESIGKPFMLSEFNNTLYRHRYKGYRWPDKTDVSGEPVKRKFAKNLSQLIYSNSCSLFPRVTMGNNQVAAFLSEFGELSDNEKDSYTLLLYALQSKLLHGQSLEEYRLEKEEADIAEEKPVKAETATEIKSETDNDTSDVLTEEIMRLRSKNTKLLSIIHDSIQEKKQVSKEFENLSKLYDKQKKELIDLREIVFLMDCEIEREEPEDETIKYPYILPGKILSFGGQASWINEMKKKLPTVIFISPDTLPNVDLIRRADEIWIQINCISHSNYYKIMDIVKDSGKQIRFFVYSGTTKCAEQVIKAHVLDKE